MIEDYINGVIKAVVTRSLTNALKEVLKHWGRISEAELNGSNLRGTKAKVCEALQRIAEVRQLSHD